MVRYLALGDSYTIGTGATDDSHNFPSLLAARIRAAAGVPVTVQNPAVNGYTTSDLIDRELPQVAQRPDLASVLIGANDIVQGVPESRYQTAVRTIYDFVVHLQLGPRRVIALSVPDFSVAPAATEFGAPAQLRQRIDAFNAIAQAEAARRTFTWIDLGEISRSGIRRPDWLAMDRLHPSDTQYAAWADLIWQVVAPDWAAAGSAA